MSADLLFQGLVGSWLGIGKSKGARISDKVEWQWTLGARFLSMRFQSVNDQFEADAYLWKNDAQDRVVLYEFSNGEWPIRVLLGEVTGSKLILDEKTADRHIQLTLELEGESNLKLTESYVNGVKLDLFVEETFRRIVPK